MKGIHHIVEIGAGFGRTAQAILKLIKDVDEYVIVDLPTILKLSKSYLRRVLNANEYKKVKFIDATTLEIEQIAESQIDLVINIDSFQEMMPETIRFYYRNIIEQSEFFYSKNAVGKYRPESVGIYNIRESQLFDVFSLGLSTEVIDIFNERELSMARARHIAQYCPGDNFSVIAQSPVGIFPYYHNVLYKKVCNK